MSKVLAGDALIEMARSYLTTVFGIIAEDSLASWLAEELQRTSCVLPAALHNENSLFDIRMRRFDDLLEASGAQHDQPA